MLPWEVVIINSIIISSPFYKVLVVFSFFIFFLFFVMNSRTANTTLKVTVVNAVPVVTMVTPPLELPTTAECVHVPLASAQTSMTFLSFLFRRGHEEGGGGGMGEGDVRFCLFLSWMGPLV